MKYLIFFIIGLLVLSYYGIININTDLAYEVAKKAGNAFTQRVSKIQAATEEKTSTQL